MTDRLVPIFMRSLVIHRDSTGGVSGVDGTVSRTFDRALVAQLFRDLDAAAPIGGLPVPDCAGQIFPGHRSPIQILYMGSLAENVDCALPTVNPKLFAIRRDFEALLFNLAP